MGTLQTELRKARLFRLLGRVNTSKSPEPGAQGPTPADAPPQNEALRDAINSSSENCRNTLLALLGVMMYLLVTVGSTTDKDLLMPANQLELPIVGVDVGLIPFYILAPALLLLLHLNLLFYLLEHRRRLEQFSPSGSNGSHYSIHAFLFNAFVRKAPGTVDYFVVSVLSTSAIVIAPFFLFILFEIRFSDYQSVTITTWHYVCVVLDLLLMALYWERIKNEKWLAEEFDHPLKLLAAAFKQGSIVGWCNWPVMLGWLNFWGGCAGALALGVIAPWYGSPPGMQKLQWLSFLFGTLVALIVLMQPRNRLSAIGSFLATAAWLWVIKITVATVSMSEGNIGDPKQLAVLADFPMRILGLSLLLAWIFHLIHLNKNPQKASLRRIKASAEPLSKSFLKKSLAIMFPQFVLAKTQLLARTKSDDIPHSDPIAWIVLNGVTLATISLLLLFNIAIPGSPTKKSDAVISLPGWLTCSETSDIASSGSVLCKSGLHVFLSAMTYSIPNGRYCEIFEWIFPRLTVKDELVFATLDSGLAESVEALSGREAGATPASLIPASLSGRSLRLADFSNSKFYGAELQGVHAEGSIWNGAAINNASFDNAAMTGAMLINATATGARFAGAILLDASLLGSTTNGADLSGATLPKQIDAQ
jgi:hypothetical protein